MTPLEQQDEILALPRWTWLVAVDKLKANYLDRGLGTAPLTTVRKGARLRLWEVGTAYEEYIVAHTIEGRKLTIQRRELHKLRKDAQG